MGTHGVTTIRKLIDAHAAAGQTLVAAPVLGRPKRWSPAPGHRHRRPGRSDRPRASPVRGHRQALFEAGEHPTAAAAIKISNNFLLGCAMEAMGEAFALVEKSAASPGLF